MNPINRPAIASDHDFIAATWSTCWGRPPQASCITPAAWRTAVWSSAPDLLTRPDVRVLVAADADATDRVADVFGWLAWKPAAVERVVNAYTRRETFRLADGGALPLVFCCYVKRDYRRLGVARRLFADAGIDPAAPFAYTCHNRTVDTLVDAGKLTAAAWCPHLGRPPHERNAHATRPEVPDAA